MVHREDGSRAFRCSDRVVYDVDPETGDVLNLPKNTDAVQIGVALPGVRVPGLDRAEA
jgi:hypothetical protein